MQYARQNTNPVSFEKTTRMDNARGMTSARAGVVVPVDYIPLLRGDSLSGRFMAQIDLKEMPKPLLNAVQAKVQAWFVPKSAHPQFSGYDEFLAAYQGEDITALGQATRTPPAFYLAPETDSHQKNSEIFSTLGIHMYNQTLANTDLTDAYNLLWNFRAAAHSSKLTRRQYCSEDSSAAGTLAPAFWMRNRFGHMVPDYERALVVGSLDLDVEAGSIPISGLGRTGVTASSSRAITETGSGGTAVTYSNTVIGNSIAMAVEGDESTDAPLVYAEMAGETVGTTLADIDKARVTQAMAKLRTTYQGNRYSGFDNDDAIVAELMQGFDVPKDLFKRPWLLDTQTVTFGMVERHATDGANLDDSVTVGQARAQLSLNVPKQDVGGFVIITVEVLPEQLHERQGDPVLHFEDVGELPNALRDIQRPEPVDLVPNWRVDSAHSTPSALYAYEPMNGKWQRDYTRLGGEFYQPNFPADWTEARSAIWIADVQDPDFTADHYLAPSPFPHDVFSDQLADAFEVAFRHESAIRGLTQIGDVLHEDESEYLLVGNEE